MLNRVNIVYQGPFEDMSGYGEASRMDVKGLLSAGVDVIGIRESYTPEKAGCDFKHIFSKKIDPNKPTIKIIRTVPELFKFDADYNIGATFWEAYPIPSHWVDPCNKVDELWLSSTQTHVAFQSSGVKTKCCVFPLGIATNKILNSPVDNDLKKSIGDRVSFLSVFQWTYRKGWDILLRAYYHAFEPDDDVVFVLKVYRANSSEGEAKKILDDISELKRQTNLKSFPPIYLITDNLTQDKVFSLYKTCDCYISASRGESFELPVYEALAAGMFVIIPCSAPLDLSDNKENVWHYDSYPQPVFGMADFIHLYNGKMRWYEPSVLDLSAKMQLFYSLNKDVKTNRRPSVLYDYVEVGKLLKQRLEQIAEEILK